MGRFDGSATFFFLVWAAGPNNKCHGLQALVITRARVMDVRSLHRTNNRLSTH